ncbi:MAG TPA: hypothetical protein P5132_01495 [Bacteroidales bacterium]|nr:hypothetical protein [Bacteroidales bacterium]
MKYFNLMSPFITLLLGVVISLSSCNPTIQKEKLLESLEEQGVELPQEIQEQNNNNKWSDIIIKYSGLLILVPFVFFGIRRFKQKKAELGYIVGDVNEKINSFKNNPEIADKMSEEEKKNLDSFLNLLNKSK